MRRLLLSIALCLLGTIGGACAQTSAHDLGGPFELIDQNGRPFSSSGLTGWPFAIFFGYTNCPDVCPTTLLQLSTALGKLGADADRLKVLFVSLDPERDTPEHLRAYLASFDSRIVGLTGTLEQVAATAKLWNSTFYKLREEDGGYTVVHSGYVYLMDRHHRLEDKLVFQDTEAVQVEKLKSLLK